MATCCDCSSEGQQYITQQYTDCCAGCICDPRSPSCFYIEAATSTNYIYQTGLFHTTGAGSNYITDAPETMVGTGRGCYYTGETQAWTINIFPPYFSGDYVSLDGPSLSPYVNNSSGSGFWQIYNVDYTYSYDRDWSSQYKDCAKPVYPTYWQNQLWGTGWNSDDDSTYTFSIGGCCMTGDCIQSLSSQQNRRCYEWDGFAGSQTTRWAPTPSPIFDYGQVRLDISNCVPWGMGIGNRIEIQLEYYADPGLDPPHDTEQWHLIAYNYITDITYYLSPYDDSSWPPTAIAFEYCDDDLSNSLWEDDWYEAAIELGTSCG